jgi:hypothetical protein
MEHWWNYIHKGRQKHSKGNLSLSKTKFTWNDLGSNTGLGGETPATNGLSHGTALWPFTSWIELAVKSFLPPRKGFLKKCCKKLRIFENFLKKHAVQNAEKTLATYPQRGRGVAYWLRHWAASRKVSGSIPSGVTGDFFRSYRRNDVPWGRDSKNEYQNTPGGKDGRWVRLTTLPYS